MPMPVSDQKPMLSWRHYIMFTSMHVTVDDVIFCDGPRNCLRKVKKLCINSMWIALLIHAFVSLKHDC